MKKNLLFILFSMTFFLTACGGQSGVSKAPEQKPSQEAASADVAFTDSEDMDYLTNRHVEMQESVPSSDAAIDAEPINTSGSNAYTESKTAQETAQEGLPADSIGPAAFLPNEEGFPMVYGSNTLQAYFLREKVIPGDGKLILKKVSDNSVVERINLKDPKKCLPGPKDSMFYLLGFETGTHYIINLKDKPKSGEKYYICLEEGAFTSQDGQIKSKAVTSSDVWHFDVAEYGISLSKPNGSQVYVGDELDGKVIIKEPAAYAKIEDYDENRVRFNEKEFDETGKLIIRIHQIGNDLFNVKFYDKEDNLLGVSSVAYNASMPPEPEPEAPKNSITNL